MAPVTFRAYGVCAASDPDRRGKVDDIVHRLKVNFNVRTSLDAKARAECMLSIRMRVVQSQFALLFLSREIVQCVRDASPSTAALELLLCCVEKKVIVPVVIDDCLDSLNVTRDALLLTLLACTPYVKLPGSISDEFVESVYELLLDADDCSFESFWPVMIHHRMHASSRLVNTLPTSLSCDTILSVLGACRQQQDADCDVTWLLDAMARRDGVLSLDSAQVM